MANGPEHPPPNPPWLPACTVQWLAAAVAVIALLGFAAIYIPPICSCWRGETDDKGSQSGTAGTATSETPTTQKELYIYTATALTGLIGAVVAMIFSYRVPTVNVQPSRLKAAGFALTHSVVPNRKLTWRQWIALAYVVVYFVMGLAAIVTALAAKGHSRLVQNLALIAIGVFIAIVQRFFNVSRQE